MVRGLESKPVIPMDGAALCLWQKACINICKDTLKLANDVLVRVSNNNYHYKQIIAPYVILQAETPWCNCDHSHINT